ncbi:AI-2E family transporter [Lactiplantibacillus mudanjiangensis]|uniref:AI-2E family transporter [Lactobacillus sp.] n=1 Tax=Lactiplantibacillus mudanjiangensis TaxID=1296538 RepID=A0A660DVG6_9LACO|nr:AI-2E family transporter [Lactiplantibacillus mudanjiangensis]VDG24012.1 AI-2E family transporter [Lactobacillus sp.] [Lactiplantibacillus mudanjiangensis]VDG27247.1 AI-2E family transporter [Lactobacillus sp.] [Lactiplantibacillus mudanjiangensis]
MDLWSHFVHNVRLRRTGVLALIVIGLYLARSMMSIILLTFIFTFLVTRLVRWVQKHVAVPSSWIVIGVYALVVLGLYFAVTTYLPQLIKQTFLTFQSVYEFYQNPSNDTNEVLRWVTSYFQESDILKQVKTGVSVIFKYITNIGNMGVTFFLSLILSFFFTVEDRQMHAFSKRFLSSTFGWFFQDVYFFAKKFVNSFGVVLEAQFLIALVNTAITLVVMACLHMPQLISLGLMIFLLSLIPVAGVIISLIPLCLIAYSVGGIRYVVYMVIMIMVVHTLEAYVLNPKFMASRTEIPIFYTFVVLLVSERLFGVWGLIVGVPIFNFILDIIGVKAVHGLKPKIHLKKTLDSHHDSANKP